MQNSFAHKRSAESNTNTNSADSSSSSNATADDTNNITNSATASNSQEQSACAVAVTCPEGSTSIDLVLCPHPPYADFVAGVGCQDGEPQITCNPSTIAGQTATPIDGQCKATIRISAGEEAVATFRSECIRIGDALAERPSTVICEFPSIQTCPALQNQHKPRQ